jgi:hypothetical protein
MLWCWDSGDLVSAGRSAIVLHADQQYAAFRFGGVARVLMLGYAAAMVLLFDWVDGLRE